MASPGRASTAIPPLHEYLIEEDEMGDSAAQSTLLHYLVAVLRWLYRTEGWFIAPDLTCYHPAIQNSQRMISPDIAVFKGIPLSAEERRRLKSWDMRPGRGGSAPGVRRPCPPVVLEVSSEGTWRTDIGARVEHKPLLYGAIGAREYFAYDPNEPPVWRRLLGWRYDASGRPVTVEPDARGWLWSAELASWLGPDEGFLRLYDAQGELRLTEAEAKDAALREVRAEAEATRRQLEQRLATLQAALDARQGNSDGR